MGVIYQSAMRILSQVLQWGQTSQQETTASLITDVFSFGIDNSTTAIGEGFIIVIGTSNTPTFPSVSVTTGGIGYDYLGNRIYISPSDTTPYNASNPLNTTNDGLGNSVSAPQSTGVVNIPLPVSNGLNYLWVDYLATIDITAFTLNSQTNAKQFYKQTSGYNIRATSTNVAPDVGSIYLGSILTTSGSGATTISQVGRQYFNILPNVVPITTPQANRSDATATYNPASIYALEAHIKAVGTNAAGVSATNPHALTLEDLGVSVLDTTNEHRLLEHGGGGVTSVAANAIIAGVPGTPYPSGFGSSAMAPTININNPGSDTLTIWALSSTEFAIVDGSAYNANNIFGAVPTNAVVSFPPSSGTYDVYWDSNAKVFGVTPTLDVTSLDITKLWLATVTYTLNDTPGHNALSALIDRRRIGSTTHLLQRWFNNSRPGAGSSLNPQSGEVGFNLTTNLLEYWDGSAWQQPVNFSSNATVPTGAMLDFAGFSAPTGFLLCDGSAVSRTTYASLYATISTIWGVGDGSTTFNVPDFRRRTAVGSGGTGTGTLGNTVGNVGGAETVTVIQTSHTHTENPHIHRQDNAGTNNLNPAADQGIYASGTGAYGTNLMAGNNTIGGTTYTRLISQTQTQSDTGMSSTTATNNPSSVIQPSAVVTKIIKI